jgi:phosphohistidine phosphatase
MEPGAAILHPKEFTMRLYFLRHGLADRNQWDGPDFERPLTREGKNRIAQSADLMDELELGLDLIITSPLKRALQTAQIVAHRLDVEDRFLIDERLSPGFGVTELREILTEHPNAISIMLVGHEPDFSDTIGELTGALVMVKKGSLVRVDVLDPQSLEGELVWLIPPKVLVK